MAAESNVSAAEIVRRALADYMSPPKTRASMRGQSAFAAQLAGTLAKAAVPDSGRDAVFMLLRGWAMASMDVADAINSGLYTFPAGDGEEDDTEEQS